MRNLRGNNKEAANNKNCKMNSFETASITSYDNKRTLLYLELQCMI